MQPRFTRTPRYTLPGLSRFREFLSGSASVSLYGMPQSHTRVSLISPHPLVLVTKGRATTLIRTTIGALQLPVCHLLTRLHLSPGPQTPHTTQPEGYAGAGRVFSTMTSAWAGHSLVPGISLVVHRLRLSASLGPD